MMPRRSQIGLAAAIFAALALFSLPTLAHAQTAASSPPLDNSLNLAWLLVAGFLVMFMQVGFAMVETGFTRSKNAVNTMAMNLIIYPIGILGFWLTGYGFMMGGVAHGRRSGRPRLAITSCRSQSARHLRHPRLQQIRPAQRQPRSRQPRHVLFSLVFMDTAATIPTGAMAERWRFKAFFIYGLFMSMFLYPLYGNWVWGGGWLSQLGVNLGLGHGHLDFAGSSVVHMTGGITALAGAYMIGPRIGKFRRDGAIGALPGHNLPMAVSGTLILAFGWFGFNCGSTLAASDPRIAIIAVNTMLASAAGALSSLLYLWHRYNKPDIAMACNGLLGGLVAITAPCAFVTPAAAVLIGTIAGLLVVRAVLELERRYRIDDPVGAIAVHGVCGIWGALALGLLADGTYGDGWNGVAGPVTGLLFGDVGQFFAQLIGVTVNIVVVFGLSMLFFKIVERTIGNRVLVEVEWSGLDALEMGSDAYPHS